MLVVFSVLLVHPDQKIVKWVVAIVASDSFISRIMKLKIDFFL